MLLRNLLYKQKQNWFFDISRRYSAGDLAPFKTKMAEHGYMGNSLQAILDRLQAFAPLNLASSWDNVGLLVHPLSDIKITNILLTNDLTEDVVQEAITTKSNLIISYHPNIFQGLKSVTCRTWKERVVVKCIKNNIAVFSPHTTWDSVKGGVNDWLAKAFPVKESQPIIPVLDRPDLGAGRFCVLEKGVPVKDIVEMVKKHVGLPFVRLALARNKTEYSLVNTVALCAGSGNSVIGNLEADLYFTGEMLHHDILDATQRNIHVILCNHSDSERGFLTEFRGQLEKDILKSEAKVLVSAVDRDPLVTV